MSAWVDTIFEVVNITVGTGVPRSVTLGNHDP